MIRFYYKINWPKEKWTKIVLQNPSGKFQMLPEELCVHPTCSLLIFCNHNECIYGYIFSIYIQYNMYAYLHTRSGFYFYKYPVCVTFIHITRVQCYARGVLRVEIQQYSVQTKLISTLSIQINFHLFDLYVIKMFNIGFLILWTKQVTL